MPRKVLQTKQIGQAPHYSGHPLAPPELIYAVEQEPKRSLGYKIGRYLVDMLDCAVPALIASAGYLLLVRILGFDF